MAKTIKILSDYTSSSKPNVLKIHADDQGDFHISLFKGNPNETGIRIAANGTRYSVRVREALNEFIKAYDEELLDDHCNYEIKELNAP